MAPPSMLHNVLAPEDPTGLELRAMPVRAPHAEGTDTSIRAAASLGGFALEPSELDHLAPSGRRVRPYENTVPTPDGEPPGAGDDEDDAVPLDEGALLELDPDEDDDDVATAGVSPPPARQTPAPTPYDDLNAALDAALDVRLDSDSDMSREALAAATHEGERDRGGDDEDDDLHVDVDLEPSTASATPEPRSPASTTSPPPDGELTGVGEEDTPRKKGFFSKIFKK